MVENGVKETPARFRGLGCFNGRIVLNFVDLRKAICVEFFWIIPIVQRLFLMRPSGEKDLTSNQDGYEKTSFVGINIDRAKFEKGTVINVNKIVAESAESTEVFLINMKKGSI